MSRARAAAPVLPWPRLAPGPDVVELFIDGARLHIRTGFGPQHGAKLFEDLLLDKAPESAKE